MPSTMTGIAAAAACAAAVWVMAPQEARAFASGPAADAIAQFAPDLTDQVRYRRRYYRPHIICGVRYRQFYNGLFWQTAPVRVCWRR